MLERRKGSISPGDHNQTANILHSQVSNHKTLSHMFAISCSLRFSYCSIVRLTTRCYESCMQVTRHAGLGHDHCWIYVESNLLQITFLFLLEIGGYGFLNAC